MSLMDKVKDLIDDGKLNGSARKAGEGVKSAGEGVAQEKPKTLHFEFVEPYKDPETSEDTQVRLCGTATYKLLDENTEERALTLLEQVLEQVLESKREAGFPALSLEGQKEDLAMTVRGMVQKGLKLGYLYPVFTDIKVL